MACFCGNVRKFAADLFKQDIMKNIFRTLCVLCGASFALTSCLSDDDVNTTTYGDVAITQFTVGTLNRYTQSVSSSTGNDTIIKTTVTGTNYPMTIDQVGCAIYNRKLLPAGTDIAHVVCSTVSTKNSGAVAIKLLTSDSLTWLSTKDSIDFSQPRIFRVFSSDGKEQRDYTVTLNVSETEGTTFGWTMKRNDIASEQFANKHLIAWGDSVALVDRGIIAANDCAYRLNGEGLVETSSDLQDWTLADGVTYTNGHLKQLIAVGTRQLFALGEDGRMKLCDNLIGNEWEDEALDDDASLLPLENIAAVVWPFAPADYSDYVLMAGNSQQDETSTVVWRKISQYDGPTKGGQWAYMLVDDDNSYALPRQDGLSLAYYDELVLAVGANKEMLQSVDQGITWQTASDYALPASLAGSLFSMAVDAQGRLWLVSDSGDLWFGSKK